MKVLTIFGTRPEAIKMAPIIQVMRRSATFSVKVCVTAQHREMLDSVLGLFGIVPDYDLNIMRPGQTLFDITCEGLAGLRAVLEQERPHVVLVQGDTTTALVGSLAAFYMQIPVGHVEAGLRTYNKFQPYPEEVNRQIITRLADIHFAPTEKARQHLLTEGVRDGRALVTGNTVVDALLYIAAGQSTPSQQSSREVYFNNRGIAMQNTRLILVTGHRRESFGAGFQSICEAIRDIAVSRPDVTIVYPVHLNPNVQEPVNRILSGINNIHLIEPLAYDAFVYLLGRACLVLTDSGGVQEEAPTFGCPVLVMREVTERSEAIDAGVALLVGTDRHRIVREACRILDKPAGNGEQALHNPFGDGHAAKCIVDALLEAQRVWLSEKAALHG